MKDKDRIEKFNIEVRDLKCNEQLKCEHKPKSYIRKYTSCSKCGMALQMKQ